jgi:hypothetical protein
LHDVTDLQVKHLFFTPQRTRLCHLQHWWFFRTWQSISVRAGKVWPIPVDTKSVTEPSNVRPTGLQISVPILHNNQLMFFWGCACLDEQVATEAPLCYTAVAGHNKPWGSFFYFGGSGSQCNFWMAKNPFHSFSSFFFFQFSLDWVSLVVGGWS